MGSTAGEISHIRKNAAKWAKPRKASLPMASKPGKAFTQPEPLGVALVVAPWNYPIPASAAARRRGARGRQRRDRQAVGARPETSAALAS